MPRRADLSNTFTKGVLDPRLSERIDLAHYYDGLESALNIEVFPQGGFRRRAGTNMIARLRRRLVPIRLSSSMVQAPNGGTIAYLVDQNEKTIFRTAAATSGTFVIAQFDLGTAQDIVFVDVIDFACANGYHPRSLAVQYHDGQIWRDFGPGDGTARKGMASTSGRTRRFGGAPGQTQRRQHWRLVTHGAANAGSISILDVQLWREKRQLSTVKAGTFARATDLVYEWLLTDHNVDIFQNGVYRASIAVDIDAAQIEQVFPTQSLDTLFLFHEDVHTVWITRQGASDEWNSQPAPFDHVPTLTSGTAFSGDQDEVQELRLPGLADGDSYLLLLEAKASVTITHRPGQAAVDIRGELLRMGVPTGVVVTDLQETTPAFRINFTGNAGRRRWPVVFAVATSRDDLAPVTTIVQRGVDVSEPFMSAKTGWPRCGVTYQERLLVAGFRGAPLTFGVSQFGSPFNFTDDGNPLTADLAFFATLDSDQLDVIHAIFIGQHIQMFTETGEWFAEARTIDATQPFNVVLATRYGLKSSVQPIFIDGATVFVQRGGRVLRDFVYSDLEQSYAASPLSLLGPHLVTGVVAMGYRPARSTDEGNHVYLVNADGTIAFLPLMRSQEVVPLSPWQTDGAFRGAFGDILARSWLIVERATPTGGADLYLEKLDGSHTLDAASHAKWEVAQHTVTGLDHLEGKQVWAWADDDLMGPFRVDRGAITLPRPARMAIVGLFPTLRARLPKLREQLQSGRVWRPPARAYEVELALAGTGQIDLAVNGGPFRDVPLTFGADRALDIGATQPRISTDAVFDGGDRHATDFDALGNLIESIVMIPGTGEFVYDPRPVTWLGSGATRGYENKNTPPRSTGWPTDWTVSLNQLQQQYPKLRHVSLVVSWFGTDLRAGHCRVLPGVDSADKITVPLAWSVNETVRDQAYVVSKHEGRAAYGGTPADRSVVAAIRDLNARGLAVTLNPFILMDVPHANPLPDPYQPGARQPAYPWRGRITPTPAPGQPGSPDKTAAAGAQIAAFVGSAGVNDFRIAGRDVRYHGPAEWSFRRHILHYAWLARLAGGVDAFVIGSELRGLTQARDGPGRYPFVDALKRLAADVKSILGAGTKVTYGADWSEYFGHQPADGSGDVYFHLDPLWAAPAIDAIGIDNYWPLADWRGGWGLDGKKWLSIHDRDYLAANIEGGEGYEWYYASDADRTAQARTPITDGLGKSWVFRFKDVRNWWLNQHFDRPGGVERSTPTAWVPQSKPVWFMEIGCGAIDKGSNQPNRFLDPKSSESALPYFSTGLRDDLMQNRHISVLHAWYAETKNNPLSPRYGGPMVDPRRLYVYCWDARPYPEFPFGWTPERRDRARRDHDDHGTPGPIWGDSANWATGHWLNGRAQKNPSNTGQSANRVGARPELPMGLRLLTGNIRITNLRGFSRHPTIEVSQSVPAPLELRAIRYQVVHHG